MNRQRMNCILSHARGELYGFLRLFLPNRYAYASSIVSHAWLYLVRDFYGRASCAGRGAILPHQAEALELLRHAESRVSLGKAVPVEASWRDCR